MSRESDPTVVHSSVALLQERFRQLQRAKEIRQERELLRLFSESEQVNLNRPDKPSRLFFHSELVYPTRPPLQGCSLYFQPNMQCKHNDPQVIEAPILPNLWSKDTVMHRTSSFDDSDVDTSLRL